LFPEGFDDDFTNFVSMNLNPVIPRHVDSRVRGKGDFSILDADKTKQIFAIQDEYLFCDKRFNIGFPEFIAIDYLKSQSAQLLPNDNLTILCEVTVLFPTETTSVSKKEADAITDKLSQNNLQEDLELAFSHREFTDIQIQCGDKVFYCHQVILAARSPVFRAMFLADMAERKTKKVHVKDLLPEVFSEMLTFMYTGKCPNLDTLACELLGAADKYQVEMLKTICVEKLCGSIDVNNCVDFLVMGDMYQASVLKKFSMDFIAKNLRSVCQTGDWRKCLLDHPTLMADVIEEIGRQDSRGKVNQGS